MLEVSGSHPCRRTEHVLVIHSPAIEYRLGNAVPVGVSHDDPVTNSATMACRGGPDTRARSRVDGATQPLFLDFYARPYPPPMQDRQGPRTQVEAVQRVCTSGS